jgi:hypothetical protein
VGGAHVPKSGTTVHWHSVVGATLYRLQEGTDPTFATNERDDCNNPDTSQPMTVFGATGIHYWRVRANNISNNAEKYVGSWKADSFFVDPPPTTALGHRPEEAIPTHFELDQNYPNPFNPSTAIHYALPRDAYVSIRIYDLLGRVVETLVDEFEGAGYKSVEFNAASLPSGVYFYQLHAGGFTDIKKMLLAK